MNLRTQLALLPAHSKPTKGSTTSARGFTPTPKVTETKAEEFLVGSLASWTLAALAAVLLTR